MARRDELARLSVPVEIDASQLDKGMHQLQTKLTGFATKLSSSFSSALSSGVSGAFSSVGQVGKGVLQGFGQGLYRDVVKAITLPFRSFGQAIADSMETEAIDRKFKAVFLETSADAEKFAKDLATKLGRSSVSIKGIMSRTQDTLVPTGFSREASTEMTKTLAMLSADLAAAEGMSQVEVMDRIVSGMVGNHEAVRRFGVMLDEGSINQKLKDSGVEGGFAKATAQEKMLARLNLTLERTADAHGMAQTASGSLAQQMEGFSGIVRDLSSAFGDTFKPAIASVVSFLREVGAALLDNMGPVKEWGESLQYAVEGVLERMRPMIDFFTSAQDNVSEFFGEAVKWIEYSTSSWEAFGVTISMVKDALDAFIGIGVDLFIETLTKGIAAIAGGILQLMGVSEERIKAIFMNISNMIATVVEMIEDMVEKAGGAADATARMLNLPYGTYRLASDMLAGGGKKKSTAQDIRDQAASAFGPGNQEENNKGIIDGIIGGMRAAMDGIEGGKLGQRAGEAFNTLEAKMEAFAAQRDAALAKLEAGRAEKPEMPKPKYSLPGIPVDEFSSLAGMFGDPMEFGKMTKFAERKSDPQVQFAGLQDIQKNIQTQLGGDKDEEKDRKAGLELFKTIAQKSGEQLAQLQTLPKRLSDAMAGSAAVLQ